MTSLARSKYRASSSRTASGSRPSASAVNPTRSANRTETRRRSATGAARGPGSGTDGCPGVEAAAASVAGDDEGIVTASVFPHSPQNRTPGPLGVPQLGHGTARRVPHSPQNLRPTSLDAPQAGQLMGEPGRAWRAAYPTSPPGASVAVARIPPGGMRPACYSQEHDSTTAGDQQPTMTDETRSENGSAPASPLGGLKINFGTPGAAPFGGISIVGADLAAVAEPAAGGPGIVAEAGEPEETRVLIIGSGPAGLTAAIYAARANLEPLVLAGSAPGGQLMLTSDIENYPGFPDAIEGPELMGRFRAQAERFGTRIVDVDVERVDLSSRPFRAWARGREYRGDTMILATGATALWLDLESEQRLRGKGVSACATCDGFFFRDREIAVVGGGDSAMEEANYLTRFASKVHLLHRRDGFRASKIMIDRTYGNPKIEVETNTEVVEVLGDGKVEGLRLRDRRDGSERTVPMEGLFIAIGHRPNTDVFRPWLDTDEMGYLRMHEHTASRIPGVFIAGDVADHRYRQAVTAAGDGARAAIDAERWLEIVGDVERPASVAG